MWERELEDVAPDLKRILCVSQGNDHRHRNLLTTKNATGESASKRGCEAMTLFTKAARRADASCRRVEQTSRLSTLALSTFNTEIREIMSSGEPQTTI